MARTVHPKESTVPRTCQPGNGYGARVDPQPRTGDLPAVHEAWLPREHSLHRPRHARRQVTALVCALVFFAMPTLLWMFGARAGEIENHKLAEFPSVTDGWGMFTDLPRWATDQLVFRLAAIQAADGISRNVFGERAPLDQGGAPQGGPIPGSPSPGTDEQGPDITQTGVRRVLEGKNGWLYFGYDVDAKCEPSRSQRESIRQLNELRSAVTDSGRKFVLTVAPDKTTMVPRNLPDDYPGKDCARRGTRSLWPQIVNDARAIDLRPRLEAASARLHRPVYFRQDTHWTDEGSLEMISAVAEQLEPGITSTWAMPEKGIRTTTADLTTMLGEPSEKQGMQYALQPDGFVDHSAPGVRNLNRPVHRSSPPTLGTINTPATVLGDSFSVVASRYWPGAFSDLRMLHYNAITGDPQLVADTAADAEIVVLQIVERSLAGGNAPILDQGFIDTLRTTLAKRPVR